MRESRGMAWLLRRRLRPLAAAMSMVLCLLVWYARSSGGRVWDGGPPIRPLAAKSASNGRLVEQQEVLTPASPTAVDLIPVVIFAFNRSDNLRLTIDSVLSCPSYSSSLHPIFISQDGNSTAVAEVIESYGERVQHLRYQWPGPPKGFVPPPVPAPQFLPIDQQPPPITPYLKIAGHYQFALNEVMDRVDGHDRWDRLIMLEDDMYLSPDFFSYFRRMSPLFDTDPSLYCVSAWNDHGQAENVNDTKALYRTDCFPGLGWMWSRKQWNELRGWTPGWWDDWLRESAQRKVRSCIYPEVNRVYTFGREGTTDGSWFDVWLSKMRLNKENVDWEAADLEYLHQKQYDQWLSDRLRSARKVEIDESALTVMSAIDRELAIHMGSAADLQEIVVQYDGLLGLTVFMTRAGLLYEHKADVPRASYRGVVPFRYRGVRIWLVPKTFKLASG